MLLQSEKKAQESYFNFQNKFSSLNDDKQNKLTNSLMKAMLQVGGRVLLISRGKLTVMMIRISSGKIFRKNITFLQQKIDIHKFHWENTDETYK